MKNKNQSENTTPVDAHKSRRAFIKHSATLTALAAAGPLASFSTLGELAAEQPADSMTHGIQIGAVSFVDEGVEQVLDIMEKRGAINTLYLTTFTHGRGLGGRQIPGEKFPDHGSKESDEKTYHGGNFATPHPEFYKNTVLKETRAPELGKFDILASVLPAAKKRGMKVFASVEDQWRDSVPGVKACAEVDLLGRRANTLCLFHPDVQAFWTALVTDICKSYPVDGILFFNERNGPLLNALGASHFQTIDSSRATCFCEHHQRAAKERGLSFERAKQGYQKLDKFVQASLKGQRPSDGYYVEFNRMLLEYPEIIAWDQLFDLGKHQVLEQVYNTVKGINKNLEVGFHIEHVNSFNPFFRATRSYEDLAAKSDFLKVVAYNICGGERYANFIRNIGSTVFKDVPLEELMRFNNHLLNYGNEASLDQLPTAGLSPDYVFRETKRALEGVKGKCKILPGIDIGIPTKSSSRKGSPQDAYLATAAAYKGGAHGVILSRKYSEMNLADIDAAGRAIREAVKNKA
ncbi:MAG: twin-arginine translocation signal domain-containing protein [Chitinophagaceae bacterium]